MTTPEVYKIARPLEQQVLEIIVMADNGDDRGYALAGAKLVSDIRHALTTLLQKHQEDIEKAVEAEMERFRETNIKKLVEEMQEDAEEYGDKHDEFCPCNMEYPDACDCETMKWVKAFTQEWMAKVNQMWVTNLYNHRKHCTPDGNKELTVIKKKLQALTPTKTDKQEDLSVNK